MTHGRPPRKPRPVAVNNMQLAVSRAALMTEPEIKTLLQHLHAAAKAMRLGSATQLQHGLLSGHIDVMLAVEDKGVVHGLRDIIHTADMALRHTRQRALASGTWQAPTLYPAEIVAIDEFARLHHWQIRHLTWAEYERATARATGQITSAGGIVTKQTDLAAFNGGQTADFERKAA